MLAENTAVCVSGLPTTILAGWITWPFFTTRVMNSGMLSSDVELAQMLRHPAPALHVDDDALDL